MPEGITDPVRSLITSAANVRKLSGFNDASRDIADLDLDFIIERAQVTVLDAIAPRVDGITMTGTRNGANRRFAIPFTRAARVIVDDTLNLSTDGNDLAMAVRSFNPGDQIPTYAAAAVESVDGARGVVTLVAAPSAASHGVEFSGRLMPRPVDASRFRYLVELLSAHLVEQRVTEHGKIVLTQPTSAAAGQPIQVGRRKRSWLALYEEELEKFRAVKPRSASVGTSMGRGGFADALRESSPEDRLYGP